MRLQGWSEKYLQEFEPVRPLANSFHPSQVPLRVQGTAIIEGRQRRLRSKSSFGQPCPRVKAGAKCAPCPDPTPNLRGHQRKRGRIIVGASGRQFVWDL